MDDNQNDIHESAYISPNAKLGKNNIIGPYCVVHSGVELGEGNVFTAHCSVGSPAEHRDYFFEFGQVKIGNDNMVREFTTINGGTKRATVMGNNCTMLRGSHLSHDSVLEDGVTLSCNVLVGGESYIMRGANIGLGAVMHQRSIIGSYSMIGMNSTITKTAFVHPGEIWIGSPARFLDRNLIGMKRAGIDEDKLNEEWLRYSELVNNAKI